MPNPPPDDISDSELLYRRVSLDDVDNLGRMRPQSVDIPSTSVNRSYNSEPRAVFRDDRRDYNGVAQIQCGRLPKWVQCESAPRPRYCVAVVWTPRSDNPAHSEIRVNKEGKPFSKNKIKSDLQRAELQEAVAANFEVLIAPHVIKCEEF